MKRAVLTAILAILPEKKRGAYGKKALTRTMKMVNWQFRKGKNMRQKIFIVMVLLFSISGISQATITEWTSGDYTVGSGDTYDILKIFNDVTLDIFDSGEIGELHTYDTILTDMYGGTLGTLLAYEQSRVNLRGGDIGTVVAFESDVVHIYGLGFQFVPYEYNTTHGDLTGLWENGTAFSIYLRDSAPSTGRVILHEIPEPATVLFLLFGGMMLRKPK